MSTFGAIARILFRGARLAADANAVERSIRTGSAKPIGKRLVRKAIGRAWGRSGIPRFPR